jgi:hypothetical protein
VDTAVEDAVIASCLALLSHPGDNINLKDTFYSANLVLTRSCLIWSTAIMRLISVCGSNRNACSYLVALSACLPSTADTPSLSTKKSVYFQYAYLSSDLNFSLDMD